MAETGRLLYANMLLAGLVYDRGFIPFIIFTTARTVDGQSFPGNDVLLYNIKRPFDANFSRKRPLRFCGIGLGNGIFQADADQGADSNQGASKDEVLHGCLQVSVVDLWLW